MSRRILTSFGTLGLVLLMAAPVWATIGPPISVRLLGEPRAAVAGEPYEGTLEIRFSEHADLDDVLMTGQGWSLQSMEPISAFSSKAGDVLQLPFVVVPQDPNEPLVASISIGGRLFETSFYVSERDILRSKQPFGVRVIENDGGMPAGKAASEHVKPGVPISSEEAPVQPNNVDWDDSDDMTVEFNKKARNIRVHGRFGYNRTDGPFIGADAVWVRIYDEDGLFDEELASVVTDAYGYYDVTFYWDPCAVFCDSQPDIYVRFDCNNSKVDVTTTGGSVYAWQTGTTNDYTGTNLNMGTLGPGDESDDPALHILTDAVRTWRWYQNRGYDNGECPFRWPDGTDGAWWSPGGLDVHIGTGSQWGEDVHSHEYSHDWHNTFAVNQTPDYCNGICDTPTCGHCLWCQETNHDAWNEGMPDWVGDTCPGSFASSYGLAAWSKYNFEGLGTCGGSVDNSELTEGILAALLLDIQDSNNDNHGAFPGVQDRLTMGENEILYVTAVDHPLNPTDFLTKFKNRYPSVCENLWETAANCGYQIDLSNPGVVTGLYSPSHSTTGDSPDNTIQFNWGVAPDDCSGIQGYSIVVSTGVFFPNATMDIGDVTTYTTAPLAPGTYYLSIRALDNAGRWSSSYTWTGPYTIRAPDPANLTYYSKTGWTYPVVPRQVNDSTFSSAPVPTSLIGNSTTYWNTLGINNGESSTVAGFQGRLYVDNVYRVGASWGAVGAGVQPYATNWGTYAVIGGRHVYETRWDATETVAETNEGDNNWGRSWMWMPLQLAEDSPVTRNAPPDSDGGWSSVVGQTLWFNCDGLRFTTGNYWEAITVRATNDADNYDIRMHLGTTSPTTGFDSNVGWSTRAAGCLDAILVNRNQVGFGQQYDGGVLNHAGGASSYVAASRGQDFHAFGDSLLINFGVGEMLKLREFYIGPGELGPVSITVDIDPADGPIYALWLDPNFTTGDLYDYDAYAASNPVTGRARLDFTAVDTGYNCLVIYRDQKDGTGAISATVEIGVTPPDFTPYWSAGWYSPLVPRPANDGTAGSVPIPAILNGNVAGTYMNLSVTNQSPSGASALPNHLYLDGNFLGWVTWGAHGGGFIGRFNWSYAFNIRGGRHVLSNRIDENLEFEEMFENNNLFGEPWVWTGYDLALQTPVSRGAPSDRTGGWGDNTAGDPNWYNCDGFQSTAHGSVGYWAAYAVLPNATNTDVDLRLHPHSTGPKNGFAGNDAWSAWGPGQSDFVVINQNINGFVDKDAGVLGTNNNGSFTVETVEAPYLDTNPSGVYGPFTVGSSRILNLHEAFLDPDVYIIHLRAEGTPVDWGLSLLPADLAYMDKYDRVPNGLAYFQPEGAGEVITVEITTAGYYCIAAWKASSADRTDSGDYRLEIFNGITAIDDEATPVSTRIAGVNPNPFNPRTTLSFDLAQEGPVKLEIFDARGQLVRTLVEGVQPVGRHEVVWDGIDSRGHGVSSGVYHFRLTAPGVVDRTKAVLIK